MNPAIGSMLQKYNCQSRTDYENALKEIIQEVALLGLWRSKFFEHAAFYGGTAMRILYGLDRFSEDLDFSLLKPNNEFKLTSYLDAVGNELTSMGFAVEIAEKIKSVETATESAFIKAGTKEHLLKIEVPSAIAERVAKNDLLKVKFEVDTDPPLGFEVEAKILLQPIAFSVKTFKLPDLFAGKIHAILQRNWKTGRIKGRDYYDFVWYVARNTPVHLLHLEQRLRQTGGWTGKKHLTAHDLNRLMTEKFMQVDFEQAQRDILPFIKDPQSVELWSNEFFVSLLSQLKTS
ncbi:MAG: nucleotidyl transferase AbiEii/AbiGii toxin family protein [Candidatus Obscuribacter sp.]|nr:nucleotidyl transferase AbiEii/AbiGii toxin family protein [Candidatus Obscuribacter sp.]